MLAVIPALLIAAIQQPSSLTVGSATARPGQTSSGFIEVPAGIDAATRIPITIARGTQSGPTLALIAGTHGSEVADCRPAAGPCDDRSRRAARHGAHRPRREH